MSVDYIECTFIHVSPCLQRSVFDIKCFLCYFNLAHDNTSIHISHLTKLFNKMLAFDEEFLVVVKVTVGVDLWWVEHIVVIFLVIFFVSVDLLRQLFDALIHQPRRLLDLVM